MHYKNITQIRPASSLYLIFETKTGGNKKGKETKDPPGFFRGDPKKFHQNIQVSIV